MRTGWAYGLALGAVLGLSACQKAASPSSRTIIAVLPVENQSGDASVDWMSRGLQLALAEQMRGPAGAQALTVATPSDAAATNATLLLHARITRIGKALALEDTVETLATHRFGPTRLRSPLGDDRFFDISREAASQLVKEVQPLGSRSVAAYRAYASGEYEQAVAIDPAFGEAWVERVRQINAAGGREEALNAIAVARKSVPESQVLPRVRLQIAEGELKNDPSLRRQGIFQLAKAIPEDASTQALAAQTALTARDYATAASYFEKALEISPGREDLLNSLAYAKAYQADSRGASAALTEYRRVSNDAANALDSEGEIDFMFGRFPAAGQRFVEVARKDPAFLSGTPLRKAAESRWVAGDAPGAAKLAAEYIESRKKSGDAFVPLHEAQWEYRAGQPITAMARLARLVTESSQGRRIPIAGIAAVQLGLWNLETGDFGRAMEVCRQAQKLGVPPQANTLVATCLLGAQPDASPDVLMDRTAAALAAPSLAPIRVQTQAFVLSIHGHHAEAIPLWQAALDATDPAGDTFPKTMLAWSLAMAGRFNEAEPLLRLWPPPQSEELNLMDSLLAGRACWARGKVAEAKGKAEDARRWFELYLRTVGNSKDRWGMAESARKETTL